ncbi:hypothetical protein ACFPAF_00550 [Hymenobacter endophyticus]|uniref:Lipoprotein n=1 Tax=Hymenobacter endophyticus TaxID=3076335 RepID=A0ABU3TBX9_9BACT|nr:hypothetical protein [Hymenobacter endophyticus]MDU0368866.1 hypothetical protein [Hymenobacter endophyticus]
MKYLRIILLVFCVQACSSPKDTTPPAEREPAELSAFLPPPKPNPYKFFKADRTDTACLAELQKAQQDFLKNKLVYVSAFDGGFERYDDELKEILSEHNIVYEPIGMNCIGYNMCYGHYMDSIIIQRHGNRFLDNMRRKADQLYLSRWATKTYRSFGVDIAPDYCAMQPEQYILSKLYMPANWDNKPMTNWRQFIMLDVLIDSTGTVSLVSFDTASNLKKSNQKHRAYFKKEIARIIRSMGRWQPAILNSHKVKCWQYIDVDLDKEIAESPPVILPRYVRNPNNY